MKIGRENKFLKKTHKKCGALYIKYVLVYARPRLTVKYASGLHMIEDGV